MNKEDLQNSQQESGSAKDKNVSREEQKNPTTNVSNQQRANLQAGLGRDRMTDIENIRGVSGRDDYAGGDNGDMSNQNTNQSTDR